MFFFLVVYRSSLEEVLGCGRLCQVRILLGHFWDGVESCAIRVLLVLRVRPPKCVL